MTSRYFELEITRMMKEDGWEKIPEVGDKLDTAFIAILEYIEWLRKK